MAARRGAAEKGFWQVKSRAPRRKVVIDASLRTDSRWSQACIVDIGERGLAMQTAEPPARGAYVEVRRGAHVIIGQVAWAKGHRFGIRTQDKLVVDAVVGDAAAAEANGRRQRAAAIGAEWRAERRPFEQNAQRNHHVGRALQFAFIATVAIIAGGIAFGAVRQTLEQPISSVTASIEP